MLNVVVSAVRGNEKMTMRQEQAAETKRSLFEAAQKLFAENGYRATPVRSINQKIGMADGLLYHYFPGGKKEILQAVVAENFKQILSRLQNPFDGLDELPIEAAIEQIFQVWQQVFHDYQDVIKILFRENEVMHLVDSEQLAVIAGGGGRWFPEFLRKRAESGEIREIDYVSATEVLKGVLFSHFLTILTGINVGFLSDAERRKKLIAYQVSLWKSPQP